MQKTMIFAIQVSIMRRKGYFFIGFLLIVSVSYSQTLNMQPIVKPMVRSSDFITHTVMVGENLYQISKLYNVSVNGILVANPGLTESVVKLGQIIRIPNKTNKKILTNSEPTKSELVPKVAVKEALTPKTSKYHTVLAGQTMYAISKMYNVKIEDIQKWNNIKDYNLTLGSQIIVSDAKETETPQVIKKQVYKIEEPKPVENSAKVDEVINKAPELNENINSETPTKDILASNNATQKDLAKIFKAKSGIAIIQIAKGTGAPITTSLGTIETVYLVLHKWLPIGTIIKVKNLVNSKIIYAKVIGKLDDNEENKHVIVRYSLGVKKDLLLDNGKCYLQIEYPN